MNGLAEAVSYAIEAGLTGVDERQILEGFCDRAVAAGIPLARVMSAIDTLHPVHEGRVFTWRREGSAERPVSEYGRVANNAEQMDSWRRSPFYHLLESGGSVHRCSEARGDPVDFPIIGELREQGLTDYLAMVHRFTEAGTIGAMDCIYISFTSDSANGLGDDQAAALVEAFPTLALALKCVSLQRIVGTLAETYLGRDAGRRVLSGRIERGVADRLGAVLWWSDLRGYTHVSDNAEPEQIIPLLNDYADAVVSAVHEAGGDVLKLIGDGTLAVFSADDPEAACARALKAAKLMRVRTRELNTRRRAEGLPVTDAYLALHLGDVFYGNIGSMERLDFTVIGPAVNKVNRIAAMCRSAERDVLLSSAFVAAAPRTLAGNIVSVGRYALRGFDAAEELFTLLRPSGD